MKITSFSMGNFKSIEKMEEKIVFNTINSFIGTNNAGKSNILKGFVEAYHILQSLSNNYTLVSTSRLNDEFFFKKNKDIPVSFDMTFFLSDQDRKNIYKESEMLKSYMSETECEITIRMQVVHRQKYLYYQYIRAILINGKNIIEIDDNAYGLMDEINESKKTNHTYNKKIAILYKIIQYAQKQKTSTDNDDTKITNLEKSMRIQANEDIERGEIIFRKFYEINDKPTLDQAIMYLENLVKEIKTQRTVSLQKNTINILGKQKNEIDQGVFALLEFITANINVIYLDEKRNISTDSIKRASDLYLSPFEDDTKKIATLQEWFGALLYNRDKNRDKKPCMVRPVKDPDTNDMYFQIDGYRDTMNGMGSQELVKILITILKERKPDSTNIICIEEPEIHIHAGLEKDFFLMIKKEFNNSDTQSISLLTTHSTNFTELYNQDTNVYLVKKDYEKQHSVFQKINGEQEENIANELGIGLEGYLFKKLVVFVEGPKDKDFLLHVSEKLGMRLDNYNIGIYEMGGHRSLETFYDATSKLFDNAQKLFGPKEIQFCFVIDKDEKSGEDIKKLQEKYSEKHSGHLFVLDKNEIENYFLDKDLFLIKKVFDKKNIDDDAKKLYQNASAESILSEIGHPAIQCFLNNLFKNTYKSILLKKLDKKRHEFLPNESRLFEKNTSYDEIKDTFRFSFTKEETDQIFGDVEKKIEPYIEELRKKFYPGNKTKNIDIEALITYCQGKEMIKMIVKKINEIVELSINITDNDLMQAIDEIYIKKYHPVLKKIIDDIVSFVKE